VKSPLVLVGTPIPMVSSSPPVSGDLPTTPAHGTAKLWTGASACAGAGAGEAFFHGPSVILGQLVRVTLGENYKRCGKPAGFYPRKMIYKWWVRPHIYDSLQEGSWGHHHFGLHRNGYPKNVSATSAGNFPVKRIMFCCNWNIMDHKLVYPGVLIMEIQKNYENGLITIPDGYRIQVSTMASK